MYNLQFLEKSDPQHWNCHHFPPWKILNSSIWRSFWNSAHSTRQLRGALQLCAGFCGEFGYGIRKPMAKTMKSIGVPNFPENTVSVHRLCESRYTILISPFLGDFSHKLVNFRLANPKFCIEHGKGMEQTALVIAQQEPLVDTGWYKIQKTGSRMQRLSSTMNRVGLTIHPGFINSR